LGALVQRSWIVRRVAECPNHFGIAEIAGCRITGVAKPLIVQPAA
jgi:hypothetical protein